MGQQRTHAPQQNRSLFDQFVSELLELQRYLEAQRLGGLEIDDQLKLCRRLQWKVGRLLTRRPHSIRIAGTPANFDPEIVAFRPPEIRERTSERCQPRLRNRSLSAYPISTPISRIRSGCCARAAKGQVIAMPLRIKSRRRIAFPKARARIK
jgi:hypothetical protein